ncbi:prepilin peptidase [Candidatus Falkowbacteria bacterium]|nr:prepilin peptidase [Candidatus Falkowbacteria bacterium]
MNKSSLILFFIFLFGLIIGSFLNALIWRLREEIPLAPFKQRGQANKSSLHKGDKGGLSGLLFGRSYCPKCRAQIKWYDNIPLLSFIILRGKCRSCGQTISWQYPLVELLAGILFVAAFFIKAQKLFVSDYEFLIFNFKFLIEVVRDWFLIAAMIVIFVYDLRWYLILDIVTLPSAAILLVLNLTPVVLSCPSCFDWLSWPTSFQWLCFQCGNQFPNLWLYLISGIIGGSFFLLQFIISRGRWIGGGDIRLGLLIGLALGWPGVLMAIFLAYFMGSIVGLGLIAAGKKRWGSAVPFGVFLSTATIIVLFFGEEIVKWYFGLFN